MQYFCLYPNDQVIRRSHEMLDLFAQFISKSLTDRIRTVLCEALANAYQANQDAGGFRIMVGLFLQDTRITLIVGDEGSGFDAQLHLNRPMPLPWDLRGRGIPIMQRSCDEIKYTRTKKGMRVVARWMISSD